MKLSVITDEIGETLEEQIKALLKTKIRYVELRKINNKYLFNFSKHELKKIGKMFDRYNIKVSTICSPIGKKISDINECKKILKKYIKISDIFNNKYIRIFGGFGSSYDSNCDALNQLDKLVEGSDKILLLENEPNIFGNNLAVCNKLIIGKNNIKLNYDIENSVIQGYSIFDEYEQCKNNINNIHLRNYSKKNEKYTDFTDGDIEIKKFILCLVKDNYNGFLSIESHLPMNNTNSTKEELFLKVYESLRKIFIEMRQENEVDNYEIEIL